MKDDPIVEEVRKARVDHARRFDFDLRAMWLDIKEQEERSERNFVSFPARPPVDPKTVTEPDRPT